MPQCAMKVVYIPTFIAHCGIQRDLARMKNPKATKALLIQISQLERKAVSRAVFDALVKLLNDESIKPGELLKELLKSGKLVRYDFPFLNRKKTIFALKDTPLVALILEISENAYISHGAAASCHGLTDKIKNIYVNIEQTKTSPEGGKLEQVSLNRAFANKARQTKNIVKQGKVDIVQLNGKNTKKLGVKNLVLKLGKTSYTLRVTSIERTLIDITVRPAYSGGTATTLECYRNAAGKVDVKKLVNMLTEINHVYPYHQAIGFYMQASGAYTSVDLAQIKQIPVVLDFFIDNAMQDKIFDKDWRIWVPNNLSSPN